MISEDSLRRHMERRKRLVRVFPLVFGALLLLLAAGEAWLLLKSPLLANPFHVMERVRADTLDPGTASLMAAMLPIMVQMCMLLALAVVAFSFAAWNNERRLLAMIALLDQAPVSREIGASENQEREQHETD